MNLSGWIKQKANAQVASVTPSIEDRDFPAVDQPKTNKHETVANSARYIGFIDRIEAHTISGWAYDTAAPNSSVVVEALADNGKRCIALANLYREDVESAGHGTGRYGFYLDVTSLGLKDEAVVVRFATGQQTISREPIQFDPLRALLTNEMPPSYADAMVLIAAHIRIAAQPVEGRR